MTEEQAKIIKGLSSALADHIRCYLDNRKDSDEELGRDRARDLDDAIYLLGQATEAALRVHTLKGISR